VARMAADASTAVKIFFMISCSQGWIYSPRDGFFPGGLNPG